MKRLLLLLVGMLALLSARAQPAPAPVSAPLIVATYAEGGPDRAARLQPLAAELGRALGRRAEVRSYPTLRQLLAATRAGRVDVALLSPLGYLLARADDSLPAVTPLAALQPPASAAYRSCLVARRGAGISTLEELPARAAGLRLVFAAEHSTSGHAVPRLQLSALGLSDLVAQAQELRYAGSHAAVLQQLQAGRADVGACGLDEFRRQQVLGQADGLQLLWTSEPLPLGPVVARAGLPRPQQQALQQVLLTLHEQAPAALAQVRAGWVEAAGAEQFMPVSEPAYQALYHLADNLDQRTHGLPGPADELRQLLRQLR